MSFVDQIKVLGLCFAWGVTFPISPSPLLKRRSLLPFWCRQSKLVFGSPLLSSVIKVRHCSFLRFFSHLSSSFSTITMDTCTIRRCSHPSPVISRSDILFKVFSKVLLDRLGAVFFVVPSCHIFGTWLAFTAVPVFCWGFLLLYPLMEIYSGHSYIILLWGLII